MKVLFVGVLSFVFVQIANCKTYQDKDAQKIEVYDQLRANIVPLHAADITNSDDDFNPLKDQLGDVTIVALGEVSHGSSEIYKMKHRLARFLIENLDFRIFSIEGNMPEAYNVNRFIEKNEEDAKEMIGRMGFWTWYTYELKDLVDWFHHYNKKNKDKIVFTGFDMQSPQGPINELKSIFKGTALDTLNFLSGQLDSLKKTKQRLNALNLYSSTLNYLRDWIGNSVDKNPKWAFQNIRILEQLLDNGDYTFRDKYMAENINWIIKNNPNSKIILWAHNEHVKKPKTLWEAISKKNTVSSMCPLVFVFLKGHTLRLDQRV